MNSLFDYATEEAETKSDKKKSTSILPHYDDELEDEFHREESVNLHQSSLKSSNNSNNSQINFNEQIDINMNKNSKSQSNDEIFGEITIISGSLIPPEPEGKCDATVEAKVRKDISDYENYPITFTENMRRKKQFANPYILEQIIGHYNIDQYGSNFSTEVFDPSNLQNRDYYDILDNESKDYSSTHRISGWDFRSDIDCLFCE